MNNELRLIITEMVKRSGEGHLPSSFSIVDIIEFLYRNVLKITPETVNSEDRDFFILSKGHGCAALYAVLHKFNFLKDQDILDYSTSKGILGGHPDSTKIPGVEASTGSLGHGFPTAVGVALGLKIKKKSNRVFVLLGDGECHEGTIWESALVAQKLKLDNLCVIVDLNGSAAQILPHPDINRQWEAFGWNVCEADGHFEKELDSVLEKFKTDDNGKPTAIIAHTVKGKGVSFMENEVRWHHTIPSQSEVILARQELHFDTTEL